MGGKPEYPPIGNLVAQNQISIAKLCLSTTIEYIYKLAVDFAIVFDFLKDKPKCLIIIKNMLKIAFFARKTRACIPTHSPESVAIYIYIYVSYL